MAVRLVYETHSTTTDNEAGVCTGWAPGELSATGVRNAEELGARRRDEVDLVVSSDLHRAVQTVDVAFAGTRIPRRTHVERPFPLDGPGALAALDELGGVYRAAFTPEPYAESEEHVRRVVGEHEEVLPDRDLWGVRIDA